MNWIRRLIGCIRKPFNYTSMQVDVLFDFAKVYNIEKADIVVGQKFTLISDYDGGKWFSDADEVLSLKVYGKEAEAVAQEKGTSTILIMDNSYAILKTLTIQVVEAVESMATSLEATAGTPVPK